MVLSKRAKMVHARTLGCECLVHDVRWRASYQHALNATRGTLIPAKYISRVNKIVCNCQGGKMDDEFLTLHGEELECSKENIKVIKSHFSGDLGKPFKEINDFLKDILAGSFTIDHNSKFRFLVIMRNVMSRDYTLLGGDKKEDVDAYPHENKFSFTVEEKFVQEIIEDKAKKLNEVITVVENDENRIKVEVKSVKKTKKRDDIKLIRGVVHGKSLTACEEGWNKLFQWLQINYDAKLRLDDIKSSSVPVQSAAPASPRDPLNKGLYVLSVAVLILGIGVSYYFTR